MENIIKELSTNPEVIVSIRLFVACLIGTFIGLERKHVKGDPAILRMYIFICVGAALVSAVGEWLSADFSSDPARIAAQVIGSIGFLGMGVIFRHGPNISGLTTASSLWVTGCIGIAIGLGAYILGIVGAIIILGTLLLVKDKPAHVEDDKNVDY